MSWTLVLLMAWKVWVIGCMPYLAGLAWHTGFNMAQSRLALELAVLARHYMQPLSQTDPSVLPSALGAACTLKGAHAPCCMHREPWVGICCVVYATQSPGLVYAAWTWCCRTQHCTGGWFQSSLQTGPVILIHPAGAGEFDTPGLDSYSLSLLKL